MIPPLDGIDPLKPPSGDGCVECLATDGWWFHLRRCAACGHIYDYRTDEFFEGPALAPPQHHPLDQPVPGPAGRVPPNWVDLLNG